MTTKNIILFGPEGPNYNAEGVVTAKFAKMLNSHGWNVYWIYHDTNMLYPNSNDTTNSHFIGIKNGLIQSVSKKLKNIPVLKYVYHIDSFIWCYKAYKEAIRIHKKFPINYTFSRIMPQYGHLPALFFKKRTHAPWIANWSDPMPRNKAPRPYGEGASAPISKIYQYYLQAICKQADAHTFPSAYLKKHYLHYLPAKEERCYTLPHIINQGITIPAQVHHPLRLSHIGGGLIERNPTLFFQALKNVLSKEEYTDISIEINFVGPIEGEIERIAKETGVAHIVRFLGKRPYHEALEYIAQADILLLIEAPMEEGIFLPSKIADIIGYHKPIFAISPPKGVLKDLIGQFGGGLCTNCLSLSSIEKGLEQLFSDWKVNQLHTKQYNTQNIYFEFSEKNIWQQLQNIITRLE